MKKTLALLVLTLVAGAAFAQSGVWNIVVVNTNTGAVKPAVFTPMMVSPIGMLSTSQYTMALSGTAIYTNGEIRMFPPDTIAGTNKGILTFHILTQNMRVRDIPYAATGNSFNVSQVISEDGQTATLTASMVAPPPMPGAPATISCYFQSVGVEVYESAKMIGQTNDLRGMTTLFPHPGHTEGKTSISDYTTMTKGFYDYTVQDAVSLWANHVAGAPVVIREGAVFDDGASGQQRFRWTYKPNGYLSLAHESDTVAPVLDVEAIDPYPWIITGATGSVSTIVFTTNGVSGVFRLQTRASLSSGAWTDARPLSTNAAPAGYMSITASNTLGGSVSFWRVSVSNAVQAAARARFSVPVQSPRFELQDGVYLYWSNGLRVQSGASNGAVNVTW